MGIQSFRRLDGDEYIRAVFTPVSSDSVQTVITNDYENVTSFLNKMEAIYYSKKLRSLILDN